ncbi:LLM class flavin-dependent oxidoreductase [Microbacterium terricola]|uniref:Oxidoreductase n=1 Tax=Microbacterium terricola TaxID=344163 RepID=A0ABM8E096_9MICO|nr:LLM class flavin-dependent oxidoreductase [Microbacterium terricola]UYK41061.1 LLM class flavin-dependent oxidoreductase [Microbacterium terricola]BDV31181.1 oxidoreductase [Microbacterium terricola]
MTRIGAIFSPHPHAPEELRDAALAAQESGIDELWLWEDCFQQSAFAAASAVLAWTETLHVGIGISPMPLRNVALTAMEITTMEHLFPGRLLPGVGHGVLPWMEQVGARVASPLTLMREYVPALRALLAGEEVSVQGRYVTLDRVRLDRPPTTAPLVYAAAEGPKTLLTSGAVADGVVLDSRHTAEEVATAVAAVQRGRSEAGRSGKPDVIAYVMAAFGADAVARATTEFEVFGGQPGQPPADAAQRVAAGDIDAVTAAASRFAAAGVDSVVLLPTADSDLREFYAAAGEVARRVRA